MANDADDPGPLLDTAVPALTAQTRPKRAGALGELGTFDFEALKDRFVEVRASGYRYTGTLVGADEQELYLRGVTRWWVLPLDRVTDVRLLADTPPEQRKPRRRGPIPGDPDPSEEDADGDDGSADAGAPVGDDVA